MVLSESFVQFLVTLSAGGAEASLPTSPNDATPSGAGTAQWRKANADFARGVDELWKSCEENA